MNKFFTLLVLSSLTLFARAQQSAPAPVDQDFGKVDRADLEMKDCDFEKGANAEMLINKGDLSYNKFPFTITRHQRIKVFTDQGKNWANFSIEYISLSKSMFIDGIKGATYNLNNGKVEVTKLEKKDIYIKPIDKYFSAVVFTLPNVKAGSVIDVEYTLNTYFDGIPTWYFQDKIPVRYSEFDTSITDILYYQSQTHTTAPYFKRTTNKVNDSFGSRVEESRVMINLPSLSEEPFMSSFNDNLERVSFRLASVKPGNGSLYNESENWEKVGKRLLETEEFGGQLNKRVANEDQIINKAKTLGTADQKIAYVFGEVKRTMKWNEIDRWYSVDGPGKAWDNNTGNSTDINLILYHLLKKSGVNALPMVVSTRDNGKVNPVFTAVEQFNRTVVYVPVDSAKFYILDASGKYNIYNEIPYELLNSYGFYVNPDTKENSVVLLIKREPVYESVFVNAELTNTGKMTGTAQISSYSYNRVNDLTLYKTKGEEKFMDHLKDGNNTMKILSDKMDNMDVDTLPLTEKVDFTCDLTGTDDNYIYFNTNLFTGLQKNPFLSDARNTDIDFGYRDDLSANAIFKIPAGYKIDVLPKSISMSMPDGSMTFKRIVTEQDGAIAIRSIIDHKRSFYPKEEYAQFYEFYKKMYETINEQVVLKKS